MQRRRFSGYSKRPPKLLKRNFWTTKMQKESDRRLDTTCTAIVSLPKSRRKVYKARNRLIVEETRCRWTNWIEVALLLHGTHQCQAGQRRQKSHASSKRKEAVARRIQDHQAFPMTRKFTALSVRNAIKTPKNEVYSIAEKMLRRSVQSNLTIVCR